MKKSEIKSLKDKNIGELEKMASDLKLEVAKLKLDLTIGKLKDVHLVRKKRKDLARVLTVLTEKRMQGA